MKTVRPDILILTSSFPTKRQPTDGIFIFELASRLRTAFSVNVLSPETSDLIPAEAIGSLEASRFQYFWPKSSQKLCSGGGILPNLRANPLLFSQVPFLFAAEFFAVRKLIHEKRIDLIHAHWLIPQGFVAACINLLYGVPCIITVHGGDVFGFGTRSFFGRLMSGFALSRCRLCTVNSTAAQKQVKELFEKCQVRLIPMGVDLGHFKLGSQVGRPGQILLFVGRLSPEKGVKYLLAAMPRILKEFKDVRLLVVGDGPERQPLEKIAASLGVAGAVEFLGVMPKARLPGYYRSADIFVGPSLREGLGMAFVEAGLCGCALVGSNVGGIPDLIKDSKTGFLIEPRSPDQISAAVIKLLRNDSLRARLARSASESFKVRFGWDKIVGQFGSCYLSILN
jgi:glycosyltransferase involved in cell wall biosynthesis